MSTDFSARLREGRGAHFLIPLLILHLVLLSIQIEDPSGTTVFRKWVIAVASPFVNFSNAIEQSVVGTWRSYIWLRGAREENALLKKQVNELALRRHDWNQVKAENARLRDLLGLRSKVPIETIGARVVSRTPNYLSNVLYLNRGSSHGVREDDVVMEGSGVLGRVVVVSPNGSQVQLITNSDASVGVMVDRTRSPGVLSGNGSFLLDLRYMSNNEPVETGDLVVTSGLDDIYPKGIPIGKVVESYKGKSAFREIRVEPLAQLVRVEEVVILVDTRDAS